MQVADRLNQTIEVEISSSESFPPNELLVNINLERVRKSREKCTEVHNEFIKRLKKNLRSEGLSADSLKTKSFRVSPHEKELYKKDEDGDYYASTTEIDGFILSSRLRLTFSLEEATLEQVWRAVDIDGIDAGVSVGYWRSDMDQLEEEVSAKAAREARRKAEILAEASNAKIVGLSCIRVGDVDDLARSNYRTYLDARVCNAQRKKPVPIFDPEDIDVKRTLTTYWEIANI